jgi:hypothetical protein
MCPRDSGVFVGAREFIGELSSEGDFFNNSIDLRRAQISRRRTGGFDESSAGFKIKENMESL